ncbi:hypothetical protein DFH06DRAFT_1316255 [Mycena polygramma]|nr:hypothetical protein DFH06DRAFT_1316255 [Mycena polygramma]
MSSPPTPTISLRSGEKARAWPKPKAHTDLIHPQVYKPLEPLLGHENCTFDIYPHDNFMDHKFQNCDGRKKYFTAAEGRDGIITIYTEHSAAYAAQRTGQDPHSFKNRIDLDTYLTMNYCHYKDPPCKLASSAAPTNAVAGPSGGASVDACGGPSPSPTRGHSATPSAPGARPSTPQSDDDTSWRSSVWWCLQQSSKVVFLTRNKRAVETMLNDCVDVVARPKFNDAVAKVREMMELNPGDRLRYVSQDGEVTIDREAAYNAYIKTEMQGSALCCCADIEAVEGYIAVLVDDGLL